MFKYPQVLSKGGPMIQTNLKTDIVIIGDGIAGLSLAYVAAKNNLRCIILGKNLPGATNAATGFLAPRPDYILNDLELVRRTAYECGRWRGIFDPQIVKPNLFLIPISPELPQSPGKFEALFDFYDQETGPRFSQLPSGYFRVNQATLEKMEPNLKKRRFDGAFALWEFTVDTPQLLEKMHDKIREIGVQKIDIIDILDYEKEGGQIKKLAVMDAHGNTIKIDQPRIIVNATGPWMADIWKSFDIALPLKLKIGVQAQVPGWYFQSGIITFGPDKKYVVCIQKNGYVQVGPTNGTDDIGYLNSIFANIIEGPAPQASFLKSGYRVKPFFFDTQRPVIWDHQSHDLNNLYSLHPGKMVLALMAADELLARVKKDGWFDHNIFVPDQMYVLNGASVFKNNLKIRWLAVKSFFALAIFYLRFLCKAHTFPQKQGQQKPHN